jgi:hypothetical protein
MAAEDYLEFEDLREDLWEPQRKSLESSSRSGYTWSGREDQQLRSMHRNLYSTDAIAKELRRTVLSIFFRLKHLGLEENQVCRSATVHKTTAVGMSTTLPAKKANPMHTEMQHLIALLQKNYTTVQVNFSAGSVHYTYKVPSAIAATLAKDDLVVVPVQQAQILNFKIAYVQKVDAEPQIDVGKPLALAWIVQKVDRAVYDDQTAREAQAIKSVETAQRRQAQEEALQVLLGTVEDREAFLKLISPVQA